MLRFYAALGGFPGESDLNQDFERLRAPARGVVQTPAEAHRIDRLNHIEQLGRAVALVGLQVPDEVKTGTRQGGWQYFGLEFLDIVLAEVPQAKRVGLGDHFGWESFGDGKERDLLAMAPGTAGGRA